ncbi:hypothetical protein PanWU01x14_136540 [Parasponia andersonii]|uniref:Uncharacterized protein n=1 Tax=Parasponia andersonii TaxID=3476 RepID=A0A2P5CNZ7_PARAD|nr:hypothetical protein PanWU01x14_136540 [Parasponia andersonii]
MVGVVRRRWTDSGQPEGRGPAGPQSQGLHQGRPLHPLVHGEVDDVDPLLALKSFEDGLVRGEVGEFEVRTGLVEVHLEEIGERMIKGGFRVKPVDSPGQGLGEEGGYLPHGAGLRHSQVVDLLHQSLSYAQVVLLYGFRAGHQSVDESNSVLLRVDKDGPR